MGYGDIISDFSGEKSENNDLTKVNDGIKCSGGDYDLKEYDELKTKLYGFGGNYESEKEVLQDQHRLEKLGICNAGRIGLRKLNKKLNNKAPVNNKGINYIETSNENGENTIFNMLNLKVLKGRKSKLVVINKKSEDRKEKMHIDEEFLREHYKDIQTNLNVLFDYFREIESGGDHNASNKISSAKGELQFLNGYKNGKKLENYNRKQGKYTPFEVALRRLHKYYVPEDSNVTFKSNKLPDWIKKAYKEGYDPRELSSNENMILNMANLLYNGKMVNNKDGIHVGSIDYMLLSMLGNLWGMKKLYYIYHHTNPDKVTRDRVNKIGKLYSKKLIKLS